MDQIDRIIAFECGELDDRGIIEMLSQSIKEGNTIAISGGRKMAQALIDRDILFENGDINYESEVVQRIMK